MPKIRKKYIAENIDEKYYSVNNNINNYYTYISTDSIKKSGILTSNKGKILKSQNSEMGTLPSTSLTTGRLLQSFLDPFDDTNILIYSNNSTPTTINSNIGLPIVTIKDENNIDKGFYVTTDEKLISAGEILESSDYFISKFKLENTNIFDSPNEFTNNMTNQVGFKTLEDSHILYNRATGKIKSELDEIILKQNRFQEEYKPFTEDYSSLEIPDKDNDFYYTTIDNDIKENYSLGNQKQIKIVLDFSDENTSDLVLLNTKFTFNLPSATTSKTDFSDNLITTNYFNFLNGQDIADSYSSHFMPTVYWNFSNSRWNYLDGVKIHTNDFDSLNLSDFPVNSNEDIAYAYLGAKNINGNSLSISPNFMFNSSDETNSSLIQENHLNNSFRYLYNKPLLTTPSFRNDQSLNSLINGNEYNKSSILKITNSYGFPYKTNWQPHNDHLLDMSRYINNNFLIEKIVVKGKFTSRGEMPIKKGNFSSGYRNASSDINSLSEFNENYSMKDNHNSDYIANGLTFFILNERKDLNYFDQNILPDSFQSYFFSKELSEVFNINKNTKGKRLDDYLGDFSSYEEYQDTLNVYSQIIPTSYLYTLDSFNSITTENTYSFLSNGNTVTTKLYSNLFHFLEKDLTDNSGITIDSIYYKDLSSWDDDWNLDLTNDASSELYKIKIENESDFNVNTGRELVSYSNFLICNKYSDIALDENVINNIDETYIINTDRSSVNDLNLNIKNPVDFEVKSFVKSIENSDYSDESIYKIKSNYYESILVSEEEVSTVNIGVEDQLLKQDSNNIWDISKLFEFDSPAAADGDNVTKLFGFDIDQLINAGLFAGSKQIPFIFIDGSETIPYLIINAEINSLPVSYFITFSYKNPIIKNSDPVEQYTSRKNTPNVDYVYWDDFITCSDITYESTKHANLIDLNLRFLSPYDSAGIIDSWLSNDLINQSTDSRNYYLGYDKTTLIKLSDKESSIWSQTSSVDKVRNMSKAFIKFIIYGLFLKDNIITIDGTTISNHLYSYLERGKEFLISNDYPYSATILLKESILDIFSSVNPTNNSIDINHPYYKFFPDLPKAISNSNYQGYRGAQETTNNELFYNYNNVLEGKNLGSANNIDITSERVIDRSMFKSRKINNQVTSGSGKILQSADFFDTANNISYLVKPEDKLVFGVSSNCNGEVMPTVVSLHDKLEITLIGRDYIENKSQKTNESKSIRKIVTGDNYIEKSGNNIYQTKNTYYDNVWSKSNILNSLEDFKNEKVLIGKNSSREFGTYTGLITFDKNFNQNDNIVYKTDTINPSIASVFFDCLGKEPLYTTDSRDRFEFKKNNTNKIPSYKILISDSISESDIENTPLRYEKVIADWHKKYHLKENEEYFNNLNNKKIVEYSYNKFKSKINDDNSNYFIYFDANSYAAGLNYEDLEAQEEKSKVNKDYTISGDNSNIHKYYKTLKTYMLPYSKRGLYQNSLNIDNNSKFELDGSISIDNFIYNDKLVEKDILNSNWLINQNWSIQYLKHNIKPVYCNFTDDVKNDILGNGTEYTSGWCIVLEISDLFYKNLLNGLSGQSGSTFLNNYIQKSSVDSNITYFQEDLYLFVSEYPDNGQIPAGIKESTTVVKNFRLIVVEPISGESSNFLVSPLYFWETNEIDAKQTSQNLSTESLVERGRRSSLYNIGNSNLDYNLSWYAKLYDNQSVSDKIGIYNEFIGGTHTESTPPASQDAIKDISGNQNHLPFTLEEISAWSNSDHQNVVNNSQILISLANHKLANSLGLNNSPIIDYISLDNEKLKNNYYTNKNKKYFTSNSFFDNEISLVNEKTRNMLDINEEINDINYLNEKVYYSNCKKIKNGIIKDTSFNFIYKIKKLYSSISNSSSQDPYKLIELKAIDNTYTLFKKNCILEDTLIYNFDSDEDLIRVNEEDVKNNSRFYSENKNIDTPYFEIDLSSNLVQSSTISNPEKIKQIPFSHYKLNEGLQSVVNESIPPSDYDTSKNYNTGSPIYKLSSSPDGYDSIEYQEDKTRDFFYGFSRDKNRYPIERLDGFKYGVECGSKKSFVYHYSNKSYGNFSDKIMGSFNCASISLNKSGANEFTWTTNKLFVNEYFQYISSSEAQNTYNKDSYSRSTYPYIEDSTHLLSQLNSNNSLYDANFVVGRF